MPARIVIAGDDTMDLIGCQETIFYALTEAIGVDGVAKVVVGVDIILAFWCCGQTELIGRLKVVQYLTPVPLVIGTATMAFINDNQVKKVAWVFFVESWAVCILGDSLIGRKVYFAP